MFIKIVIVLLLLIVAASLLSGGRSAPPGRAAPARSRVRPLMTRVALILLALGAAVALVHLAGCGQASGGFHATEVREAGFGRLAALEALSDPSGRRPASADFQGKAVVVFFGYTHCPDICPTTLTTMAGAMHLLGTDAERVRVLFITVDPERDTPEVLAAYVPWFDARFLGLSGNAIATRDVAREFRIFYSKANSDSAAGYAIDHTAISYAYDPQGRLRLLIRHGESAENIAADLRRLLAGK